MSIPTETTAARERDPVCGMSVRLDVAVEDGLVAEHEGHTYYFCRPACRDAFVAAPADYITSHGHAAESAPAGTATIDEGMRRWYESCSCCLSDAYPEVKAALDAERAARHEPGGRRGHLRGGGGRRGDDQPLTGIRHVVLPLSRLSDQFEREDRPRLEMISSATKPAADDCPASVDKLQTR